MLAVAWISVVHWAGLPNFYGVCHKPTLCGTTLAGNHGVCPSSENTSAPPLSQSRHQLTAFTTSAQPAPCCHMVGPQDNVRRPNSCFLSSCQGPTLRTAASLLSRCPPAPHISLDVPRLALCPIYTDPPPSILMVVHLRSSDL